MARDLVERAAPRTLLDTIGDDHAVLEKPDGPAVPCVDLASQALILPDACRATFPIDTFSKTCLLKGIDQLGYLLEQDAGIAAYEQAHPARVNTVRGKTS